MKSLQDYKNLFQNILNNLEIKGDSAEILKQLFAQATYISEVEHVEYVQEASIEKAVLLNSKIQHCMNEMYSVYRGQCPRVILKIKPTKILELEIFSKIITSNNFAVYYLGYYSEDDLTGEGENQQNLDTPKAGGKFIYSDVTIYPSVDENDDKTYTIIGALAKEVSSAEVTANQDFITFLDTDLSNDVIVYLRDSAGSTYQKTAITRNFSDHVLSNKIFDLTTTDFGSRLFLINSEAADSTTGLPDGSKLLLATYLKYSLLSTYNNSELERLTMKGATLVPFDENWIDSMGYPDETKPGVIYLPESPRDGIGTIHYKAYRERFTSSLFRSNNDIGALLESTFPDKIATNGTSTKTETENRDGIIISNLHVYYIPEGGRLSDEEIEEFKTERSPYYVEGDLIIEPGVGLTIDMTLDVVLFRPGTIDYEVQDLVRQYENKFGVDFSEIPGEKNIELEELKTNISKISNVRWINGITLNIYDEDGNKLSDDEIAALNLEKTYYSSINCTTKTSY